MASRAFLELIARWEAENGRSATDDERRQILEDALAEHGVKPRADGKYHRADFEPAWRKGVR